MTFMFEDEPRPPAPNRRVGAYVSAVAVVLLIAAGAGWYVFAQPGASAASAAPGGVPAMVAPEVAAPTASRATDVPATAEAQSPADSAAARAEPVEEILESTPAQPAQAAPAAAAATAATAGVPAPATPVPAFTPVTVPRVPDAAPAQAPARPQKSVRSDDAPWPPAARESAPPVDPMARLRGALAQCAAMSNELSRGNCLARTRQNFCGDAWGRIPECPAGQ